MVSSLSAQLEVESHLISAAVEEHEHEKRRAAGLDDEGQAEETDSSPTDWDGGGGILAAASAMLAKMPANFKAASPTSSPRVAASGSVDGDDASLSEARDRELKRRKKALRTRQLELGRVRHVRDVRLRRPVTGETPFSPQGSPRGSVHSAAAATPRSSRSWKSNESSPRSRGGDNDDHDNP